MRPQRKQRQPAPPFLHSIDCRGRLIAPAVLAAATEIGPRALRLAETRIGDPAAATSLLEQAAATVTRAIETKIIAGEPEVENLQSYLFRAFLRLVKVQPPRSLSLEQARAEGVEPTVDGTASLHDAVLLNEVLEACDKVGHDMLLRRLKGFAWDEIAHDLRITSNAARLRFSKILKQARKTLNIQRSKEEGRMNRAVIKKETKTHAKKRLLRADFSPPSE
jgi:DNA-directed RNA polymerase specialized sigma24 family protein